MVGLKQSPNFLSMRLVQENNIKVGIPKSIFKKYVQDTICIFKILVKSILHNTDMISILQYLAGSQAANPALPLKH